ncbi:TIGR03086 family protein [Amycolatopsis xylanica]|uniref:TIGR03086 family protein n=1 Tax=Amycolatopsis xylanica TaxID=589385 RepID=A0A1H3GIY4_9PSEU|nr:TIGR03086 family metal-binding protein [Amycolatopsis xylanica]SDY03231.1 TIGR03086 family protein [Amycolatopsis xylanica]
MPEGPVTDQLAAAEASLKICVATLHEVGPEDGTRQTPCADFDIDQVVEHLLGSLTSLSAIAGKPLETVADGTHEAKVAAAGRHAIDAWRARGLDGVIQVGPNERAASLTAAIVSLELLVHAWDVAVALGRTIEVSDELSSYVLEQARQVVVPQMRAGRFGPEVAAPEDATSLERLIAFTGRTS